MSRCKACDIKLNDMELKVKDEYGNFLDMCFRCSDQTYLYAFAEFDVNGDVVSLGNAPECSYKWDYVGGVAISDDTDLTEILLKAGGGKTLNKNS